eukprot:COSAG02_NODE_653_length_18827_cov_44.237826_12_plen_30_part_00
MDHLGARKRVSELVVVHARVTDTLERAKQ